MATINRRAIMEFTYLMAKHSSATITHCQRLLRLAATHQRLMVQQCNGPWGEQEERRVKRLRDAIQKLTTEFDAAGVNFGGDPRGATVKIRMADGYTNDWGREGVCVPAEA